MSPMLDEESGTDPDKTPIKINTITIIDSSVNRNILRFIDRDQLIGEDTYFKYEISKFAA